MSEIDHPDILDFADPQGEYEKLRNLLVEIKTHFLTHHNLGKQKRADRRLEFSRQISTALYVYDDQPPTEQSSL